jgi:hypothetical protein
MEMESEAYSSLARNRVWKEERKMNFSLARAAFVGQTVMYLCFDRDLTGLMHFETNLMYLTHLEMGSADLTDFDTDLTDFWGVGWRPVLN